MPRLLVILFAALPGAAFAELPLERVELPLETVITPRRGYDDNDQVVAVAHGELPNGCYTLAEPFVEHLDDGVSIRVRQFANRDRSGICAEDASVPPHMQMTVPFANEASLGTLPAANYRILYKDAAGRTRTRSLNVAIAPTTTVDSLPYALITGVNTQDMIGPNERVRFELVGALNSTCTELDPVVRTVWEDDVLVVLPTLNVKHGVLCAQMIRPFSIHLDVGRAGLGHRLIHVRSMNGKAINKLVTVLPAATR
jgi:hypothetical protein